MNTFTMIAPDDMHVHLRSGDMLAAVLPHTAMHYARALVMPNLRPRPVLTAEDALRYKEEILSRIHLDSPYGFQPLMSIQVNEETTAPMIHAAADAGVVAGKVYPRHGTTNSDNGVSDLSAIPEAVLRAMTERRLVLCLHAERPGVFVLDREAACVSIVIPMAERHRDLRIVWEHVSSKEAVQAVRSGPDNLAATITVQHQVYTLDDIVGQGIRPHHFCMPVAKTPDDRRAVIEAATSGNPKFFFGSDSAPHLTGSKECAVGAAGVFSAPCALEVLAMVFEEAGALDKLEAFTSKYGAQFYGLPLNEGRVKFVREDNLVPEVISGIVPFMAGKTLPWRVL